MKSFISLPFLSFLFFYTGPTEGFWRLACSVSQTSRIDPILSPGSISGHVHKFAGGNSTEFSPPTMTTKILTNIDVNENSNQDSLQGSSCSTCEVQKDKSAYWTPQLYYEHANGQIEEVQNDGMTVYYVGRGGNSSNTQPFPSGFKMISGNSQLRHYNSSALTYQNIRPIADRVSFRCINEANNIPETHYINQTNCVNGLRAQINFQSCWDGVNLYKSDQSHVAYLSGIDYGSCPPTHPVPIPGLFFEVLYYSNRIVQTDGGRFVFSNGDTTGFGFHGDFLNGWDQSVQTQAVRDCLYVDNGGVVSACEALAASDDVNFSRNCLQSPQAIDEVYTGTLPMNALPGCNPITSGPADAPQVICNVNGTTPIGTTSILSTPPVSTVVPTATTDTSQPTGSTSSRTTGSSSLTSNGAYSPIVSSTTSQSASKSTANTATVNPTVFPSGFSRTLGTFTQPTSYGPGVFAQGASTASSQTTLGMTTSSTLTATSTSGSKLITLAVPSYTTIAIVIPASLTPETSFSNLAEASSYIASLVSIANAEESSTTTTTITASASTALPTVITEGGVTYTIITSLQPSDWSSFIAGVSTAPIITTTVTMTTTIPLPSTSPDASNETTTTSASDNIYPSFASWDNATNKLGTPRNNTNSTGQTNRFSNLAGIFTTFVTEYAPTTIENTVTTDFVITPTSTQRPGAFRGRRWVRE